MVDRLPISIHAATLRKPWPFLQIVPNSWEEWNQCCMLGRCEKTPCSAENCDDFCGKSCREEKTNFLIVSIAVAIAAYGIGIGIGYVAQIIKPQASVYQYPGYTRYRRT